MKIKVEDFDKALQYKKKKESSVSKATDKSKHRHCYDKTVVVGYWHKEAPAHSFADVHKCCTICGKLKKDSLWWIGGRFDHSFERAKAEYPDAEYFLVPYDVAFSAKNIEDLRRSSILNER